MDKVKVLFLCTGNTARSQMAEAFLRKYAGDRFEAYSAGLEPKAINPYTIRVMEEVGISLEGHTSQSFKEYMGTMLFGYLITVCTDAEERCPKAFPGVGHRIAANFEDPAAAEGTEAEKLQKFRDIRDQIDQWVQGWLQGLTSEAD